MSVISLTKNQYIEILNNLLVHLKSGAKFEAFDDDTIGCKYTTCSWGMCCGLKAIFPKPEYHIWPDEFTKFGRIAPMEPPIGLQQCPHDLRKKPDWNGCFYTCAYRKVFDRPKQFNKQDRAAAIKRTELLISELNDNKKRTEL